MLTVKKVISIRKGKEVIEGECLSTDQKPIGTYRNGSILLEMDTSKLFFYDEANSTWREWS